MSVELRVRRAPYYARILGVSDSLEPETLTASVHAVIRELLCDR
jgi:hypothetical protein